MANGLFKKKNFGAMTNNSQSSTDNTADNELMSCRVTSDEDETPEGLSSTDGPIHVVHTRSKTPPKTTPPAAKEPEDSTTSIAVAASELHAPTQEQATSQTSPAMSLEPAAQVASMGQPGGIDNTQDSQPADSLTPPKTPLAAPLPPPTQEHQAMSEGGQQRRTRRPPKDGKKSLVARIDVNLHKRVIMTAEARDLSMTDLVILMIEHCCPAP